MRPINARRTMIAALGAAAVVAGTVVRHIDYEYLVTLARHQATSIYPPGDVGARGPIR